MHNIRCKSKETTSFSGGVAQSEEYITSEDAGADTSRMADTYIWIVNGSSALAAVRFYFFLVALRLREGVGSRIYCYSRSMFAVEVLRAIKEH